MELKKGDKVVFLNETGGGTITKIIDSEMVSVLNEDGFEIPVLMSEVIKDKQWTPDAVLHPKTESIKAPEVKQIEEETPDLFYSDSADVNLYLAAVPKNPKYLTDEGFDLYLINDSNYFLSYTFNQKNNEEFKIVTGQVEPNLKIHLQTIARDNIQEDIQFFFQCIFYDKRSFTEYPPLQKTLKLKIVKIFKEGAYKTNDFFDKKALIITILEDNLMNKAIEQLSEKKLQRVIKHKENQAVKKISKPKQQPEKKEVDLHLHQILDDETGMSDADKLEYQLNYFRAEMDKALKNGSPKKIVFIHGIGVGKLKHKLRSELQRKYKSCLYQDASFAEYGFGATLVLIRKPK